MFLEKSKFSEACDALPLVSIDLFLICIKASGCEVLLGYRNNMPANNYWFTPGGRIRKNESFESAMCRIAQDELGLNKDLLKQADLLGVWDHFYPNSAFDANISTHYVNLPHLLLIEEADADLVNPPVGETEQHSDWCWWQVSDALAEDTVHENVKNVLRHLLQTQKIHRNTK